MKNYNKTNHTRRKTVSRSGCGFFNRLIDNLPIELHIPGYNYCGPGTKLNKRLARNDKGVNLLDEACKSHDIAYSQTSDISKRHEADRILADKAAERYQDKSSSIGEKLAALGVKTAMKAKVKLGMGCSNKLKRKRQRKIVGGKVTFSSVVKNVRNTLKSKKPTSVTSAVKIALKNTRNIKKNNIKHPRIIPIPKTGGFLPLIPLFAGLSALGALAGGASSIASAVNKAKMAQEELKEKQRHNQKMESIAVGSGLHIKPYKKGLGLFVNPYSYYEDRKNFY